MGISALAQSSNRRFRLKQNNRADGLDDSLWLAGSGTYGTLDDVRRKIAEFLERYAEFDEHIPLAA